MQKEALLIVTGGAGFVGSNLVQELNSRGHTNILVVDHLTTSGKWKNLVGLSYSGYLDRTEFLSLVEKGAIGEPAVVLHMGACSKTTELDENHLLYNNAVYSKKLFDYCASHDCRLIYASSAATYGDGSSGYRDTERDLKPLNCYGYSKHLMDQWALDSKDKPPQWVGLKFFNVFGPNEAHKGGQASVALHGFNQIQRGERMKLFKSDREDYADGSQKRDFIYVKDAAKIVGFFLDNPGVSGIYNAGTGEARTFKDLGISVYAALGRAEDIEYVDMPDALRGAYQYFTEADVSTLRNAGYKEPFMRLEDSVADYVQNYLLKG